MRRWSEFQPHRGWLSNQWLGFQPVVGNPPMVGEFPTIYLSWPWCSGGWRVLLGRVDNGQIYQVARVSTFDHLLSSRPTWLTLQMVTEGKSTSDKDAVVSSIEVIGFCWGLCYLGKCLVRLFFLRWHKTRSFWINCALKGDEAVYWVSIGQRWLVLDGTESV